jgi:hypothetical protein
MEYIVKDQIERYSTQRKLALEELLSLNENLPFYDKKKSVLEIQITNIDSRIFELVMAVERIKIFEATEKSKTK